MTVERGWKLAVSRSRAPQTFERRRFRALALWSTFHPHLPIYDGLGYSSSTRNLQSRGKSRMQNYKAKPIPAMRLKQQDLLAKS
jgi:hypothetical protein